MPNPKNHKSNPDYRENSKSLTGKKTDGGEGSLCVTLQIENSFTRKRCWKILLNGANWERKKKGIAQGKTINGYISGTALLTVEVAGRKWKNGGNRRKTSNTYPQCGKGERILVGGGGLCRVGVVE